MKFLNAKNKRPNFDYVVNLLNNIGLFQAIARSGDFPSFKVIGTPYYPTLIGFLSICFSVLFQEGITARGSLGKIVKAQQSHYDEDDYDRIMHPDSKIVFENDEGKIVTD